MRSEVTVVIAKRMLVGGGLVAALVVPAGVAVAAAATSPPGPASATTQPSQPSPGYGPGPGLGYGRMMGGSGDLRGCPYYNSPEMQQHRAWMWAQRTGTTSP